MNPEELARRNIDRQLAACGWIVQDYREMNLSAGLGVAVREFPLATGEADYLLYADGKAIGVVEAKPEGHTLAGVEIQSGKYLNGLPSNLPSYRLPLPFTYESTGAETRFSNYLEHHARSRGVFAFHRPEELIRLVTLDDQVRSLLRAMPPLNDSALWKVQTQAITNLEKSLADNRPRALIQMATGSGKTFTAVNACYRLIRSAKAKRILFLVDRNNLGKQTLNEFQQFVSPYNGYKFTEEYSVQHLKTQTINPASKVCITTIQRLYAMLQGEEEFLEENEEGSLFETETSLIKQPLPVVYNPKIPIETFDFIIVDECHRSIYNLWRQVLAALMRRMNICEERGSGVDKVIFNIELFQLPAPDFQVTDNHTKAILFAPRPLKEMDKADRIRACYQHACLCFVSNQKMTNSTLRKRFSIEEKNYAMASRIIAEAVDAGLIKSFDPESTSKKFAKYLPFWV